MSPTYSEAELRAKVVGLNLLIVDDAALMRDALKGVFEKIGFHVHTAESGKAAFELIQNVKFHGVISDVRMPEGDGLQLLENIRKFNASVPLVVLMTGFADTSAKDVLKKGAIALVDKPFDTKKLVALVLKSIVNYLEQSKSALTPTTEKDSV